MADETKTDETPVIEIIKPAKPRKADKILKSETFMCPDCNMPCIATKFQIQLEEGEEAINFGGNVTAEGVRIDLYHSPPQCITWNESVKHPDHVPAFMQLAVVKRTKAIQDAQKASEG